MKLSVVVPTIRPQNWGRLIHSVEESLESKDFEIIFVGPKAAEDVPLVSPVRFISDWGSPARAQSIGVMLAEGDYVTWGADDGWFLPSKLKELFQQLSPNEVYTSKYREGIGDNMTNDTYYKLRCSINMNDVSSKISPDFYVLNVGIIPKNILQEYGGLDGVNFETTFFSHLDLALRMQLNGIKLNMYNDQIFSCTHMPGDSGDHKPIFNAHPRDCTKFCSFYYNEPFRPIYIAPDNWKNAPQIWKERF